MHHTTSSTISIVAPHEVQAEIQRLFKMPIAKMRATLGGDVTAPQSGSYLRPEYCIDHLNLYYINGDGGDSWRYDMNLVSKRFPQARIYFREMHDDGKAGAKTNDHEALFFTPYGVMAVNNSMQLHHSGVDLAELRRAASEIWTKQNRGFMTLEDASRFIDNMRTTFPDLDKWTASGDLDLWINHFEPDEL